MYGLITVAETRVRATSERKMLRDIRRGLPEAREQFVRLNYAPVYRFFICTTGDSTLSEDLTQETFASAWAAMAGYRGGGSVSAWLHRIAYNKFIDHCRRVKRNDRAFDSLRSRNCPTHTGPGCAELVAGDEQRRILWAAVRELEPPERAVVVLHYVRGLSLRQTARILAEPLGTVKWRTNRGLKTLRNLLAGRMSK